MSGVDLVPVRTVIVGHMQRVAQCLWVCVRDRPTEAGAQHADRGSVVAGGERRGPHGLLVHLAIGGGKVAPVVDRKPPVLAIQKEEGVGVSLPVQS